MELDYEENLKDWGVLQKVVNVVILFNPLTPNDPYRGRT